MAGAGGWVIPRVYPNTSVALGGTISSQAYGRAEGMVNKQLDGQGKSVADEPLRVPEHCPSLAGLTWEQSRLPRDGPEDTVLREAGRGRCGSPRSCPRPRGRRRPGR